jgi:hypothetical protein
LFRTITERKKESQDFSVALYRTVFVVFIISFTGDPSEQQARREPTAAMVAEVGGSAEEVRVRKSFCFSCVKNLIYMESIYAFCKKVNRFSENIFVGSNRLVVCSLCDYSTQFLYPWQKTLLIYLSRREGRT